MKPHTTTIRRPRSRNPVVIEFNAADGLAVIQILEIGGDFLADIDLHGPRGRAQGTEGVFGGEGAGPDRGIEQAVRRDTPPAVCRPRSATGRADELDGVREGTQGPDVSGVDVGRQAHLDFLHLGHLPAVAHEGVGHLKDARRHLRRVDFTRRVQTAHAVSQTRFRLPSRPTRWPAHPRCQARPTDCHRGPRWRSPPSGIRR